MHNLIDPLYLIRRTHTSKDGVVSVNYKSLSGTYATPHLYTLGAAKGVAKQMKARTWDPTKTEIIPVTFVLGEPIE